jgi:hypothetical protein
VRFRELIGLALDAYRHAERYPGKAAIVQAVIETVHAMGGRFLAHRRDRWIALTTDEQRDKVGHAIRDAAAKAMTTTEQQSSPSSSPVKLGTGSGKKSAKVSSAGGSSSPGEGGGGAGGWSLESCLNQSFDGKTDTSSLPPYIDDLRRRLLRLQRRNRIHGDGLDDDEPQRQPPLRTDDSGPSIALMTKRRHAITAASDTVLSASASSSAETMRQSPVAAVAVSSSDYGSSIGTTTTSAFASMPDGRSSNSSSSRRRAGRHDHDGPALRHHSLIMDPPGVRKRDFMFDRVAIIAGLARRHGSDGALLPLRRGEILSTTTAAGVDDNDDDPRQRRRQRQIRRSSSATQSSIDTSASFSSILQDTSEVFPYPSSSSTGNGGTKTLVPGHQASDGMLRPSSEYHHHLHFLPASNNDSQRSGMSAMQQSIGTIDSIGDLDHSSMSFDLSVYPTTTASTAFHLDDHQSGISSDFRYIHPQPPQLQSGIRSEFRYTHQQPPQLQQRLPQPDEYLHHPLLRQSQTAWDQAVFQQHLESQELQQALQQHSPKRMMMTHPQTIDQQPQHQQQASSMFGDTLQVHPTLLPPHFPSFPQQQQQQLAQRQHQQQQLELQRRQHEQLVHQQQQHLLLQQENHHHHPQTVDTIPHPYSNLFEHDTDDDDDDNDLSMLPAAPPPASWKNDNQGQQF